MGRISATAADEAKVEFKHFVNTDAVVQSELFLAFNKHQDHLEKLLGRLEKLLGRFLCGRGCENISMTHSFVLSHGQSQIEQSFNINKNSLNENRQQLSPKSKRLIHDVYDGMTSSSSSLQEDEITNRIVANCAAAYKVDMEAKKVTDVEVTLAENFFLIGIHSMQG